MDTSSLEQRDLLADIDDVRPRPAGKDADVSAPPTALDKLCEGLPPDDQAWLLRFLQDAHIGPKDPSLSIAAVIQHKINCIAAEAEAKIQKSTEGLEKARYAIVDAETGATKYAARLREITEETKVAVAETTAHLEVLGKLKQTAGELLAEQLKASRVLTVWQTVAGVAAADFALRLLFAYFH